MKVIDLYVKIANKEEVPEKIKYEDKLYVFVEEYEKYYRFGLPFESFEDDWYLSKILNDEIEIIEDTPKEDKKIEKLDISGLCNTEITLKYCRKINEIIDFINRKND